MHIVVDLVNWPVVAFAAAEDVEALLEKLLEHQEAVSSLETDAPAPDEAGLARAFQGVFDALGAAPSEAWVVVVADVVRDEAARLACVGALMRRLRASAVYCASAAHCGLTGASSGVSPRVAAVKAAGGWTVALSSEDYVAPASVRRGADASAAAAARAVVDAIKTEAETATAYYQAVVVVNADVGVADDVADALGALALSCYRVKVRSAPRHAALTGAAWLCYFLQRGDGAVYLRREAFDGLLAEAKDDVASRVGLYFRGH